MGDQWAPRSHATKDFLSSNLVPYKWIDVSTNQDAAVLLDSVGVSFHEAPLDDAGCADTLRLARAATRKLDSTIGADCVIGPFASIPRGSILSDGTTVANNVGGNGR